jgi:hypothetical protein
MPVRARLLSMRRSVLALFLALGALAFVPYPSTPAAASCAGPLLELPADPVLQRGTALTVEGAGFVEGCRDTMSCSGAPGCESCEYDEPPERPLEDVDLMLVQRGRSWVLATADAGTAEDGRLGRVRWAFELPPQVRPGRAALVTGTDPVAVRIG